MIDGNAGQQLDRDADRAAQPGGQISVRKMRDAEADRHGDQHGDGRGHQRAVDRRQGAELLGRPDSSSCGQERQAELGQRAASAPMIA